MLLERDRKLFYIFAVISIALSLIVCIPFSLGSLHSFEIIVKYMVIPAAILVFTFLCWTTKYRSYRPSVKFTTIVTSLPAFSYIAAVTFNTLLILVRNSEVYDSLKYNLLIIFFAAVLVAVIVFSHVYQKLVIVFSKNESMVIDGVIAVIGLSLVALGNMIAFDYKDFGGFETKNALFIIVPIVLGLAAAALHFIVVKSAFEQKQEFVLKSRQELYEKWENNCLTAVKIYEIARENILETLLNYNLDELGFEEVAEEETEEPVEVAEPVSQVANEELENKIKELEAQNKELKEQLEQAYAVISTSKEMIVDTLQKCADNDADLIMDSLQHSLDVIVSEREVIAESRKKLEEEIQTKKAELQAKLDEHAAKVAAEEQAKAEAEEKARQEAERRAKEAEERAKEKKAIEPEFAAVVEYAVSVGKDRDDVEFSVNDKQTVYKFVHDGTAYITLQKTNNDYRISFLAKTDDMRALLYQYNGVISFDKVVEFAKAKYSIQQLKVVYKGDETITFEAVQELLTKSLEALLEAEELEQAAIAKEQAAKERAKLAEQALREKERAIAKEEAKRQKELEKAAKEENPEEAA